MLKHTVMDFNCGREVNNILSLKTYSTKFTKLYNNVCSADNNLFVIVDKLII